ncbi:hypothetical protein ACFLQK_02595 [bacterium]
MTFLFMILALARHVLLQVLSINGAWKKTEYHQGLSWKNHVKSIVDWLIPVRHIYRNNPLTGILSFSFHVGLIIVPIFFMDHVFLWNRGLGISWPGISKHVADVLSIVTIVTATILFVVRIVHKPSRFMSGPMDYFLLVLLTLPFVTGFLAAHPAINPVRYNITMLIHVLSSEMIFVLIPLTKLSHCVLFPFDRISSDIFWRFPAEAGELVAVELHGEEVKV